jgi:hypothetical protein
MNTLLQGSAAVIVGRGYLSSDHFSTATGLSPAITISKNGGSFANPAAGASVMTEIGTTGWYKFSLGTGDTDTIGALIIRATSATMDTIEVIYEVVKAVPVVNVTQVNGTAQTATMDTIKSETAAIKAKTDNLPASPAATGDIPAASTVASAVRTNLTTELGRIDAAVSTRAPESGGNVAAIKAKTDNLPASPANETTVASRLATSSYTAPDNAGISAIKAKTDNLPASPSAAGDIPSAATVASAVRTNLATELGRVDAAVSTRAIESGGNLAAIKAKTDNLPADPADQSDIVAAFGVIQASIASLESITVADILAGTVEGSTTVVQLMRALSSYLMAKASGGGTDTIAYRDLADTKDRIVLTVDENGNRTAVLKDLS